MGLYRIAWRALAARRLRTFLTMIGVALGVGVLSASLTIGAGLDAAIDRTVRDVIGIADLRVSAFLDRGLGDAAVAAIRGTEGVEVVAPTIERRTFLGAAVGRPAASVTVVGVDPAPYFALHPVNLLSGALLARTGETSALITESLAAADGYEVGSELTIQGSGAPEHVRIIGILAGPGPVATAAGRTVIIPIETASRVFGTDRVSRVDIGLAAGVTADIVAARLADRITTEPYVLASPAEIAAGMRASTADFQATTALLAAIVLFGGSFLIINTLSMTVGERAREVGLLRAAGATRRQIRRFVLAGAAAIGVAGSALGLVIGAGLGAFMSATVRALTGFPTTVGILSPGGLAIAFLVGVAITIAAAIEPAVRASRTSPVEALRAPLDLPAVRRGRLIWLAGVFVTVAALALVAWPAAAGSTGADRAVAVYALLIAVTLATPFLLPPLARLVGFPVATLGRLEERLARGSLARDRNRTALTVGALIVGIAMIVALGWTAQAARERATAWLADVIPGDQVLTSIRPVTPDEGVEVTLAASPGVRSITPIATFELAIRGVRFDAAAIRGADFLADGRLSFTSGDRTAALTALDAGGSAVLPTATAHRLGLGVGDHVALALGEGRTLDLTIAGIVARSIPSGGGEAILIGWKDATDAAGVVGAEVFAVRFAASATAADRAALDAAATGLALEPNPLTRIQGAVTEALGRVFGLFDALALVAVLIAGLGIVNTLAMGVMERIREIGVLRAIGMTRGQIARMVVVEAAILGAVGALLGSLTGVGVGAILLFLTGGLAVPITLPWATIGLAAALGVALAVAAAYYPARVAARISIVRAVALE